MTLSKLEYNIGHYFNNCNLLIQSLTHRSYSVNHNERLEFLGDSILNTAVTFILYRKYNNLDEGVLSRLRANLVKEQSLVQIAKNIKLPKYLRLGDGEVKSGGFYRSSVLANAVEAIFGAVFQDAGFDKVSKVIEKQYKFLINRMSPEKFCKDSKTLLQELLQSLRMNLPIYTIIAIHGLAHNQQFEVECNISSLSIKSSSLGTTRRAAEQLAAESLLKILHEKKILK